MAGSEQTVSILAVLKDQLSQPLTQVAKAAGQAKDETEGLDKASLQFTGKVARLSQRLLSLQFAFQQLTNAVGQTGSGTGFTGGIEAASAGLNTFAGVIALLPNKAGLVIGVLAGISAAFRTVAEQTEAAKRQSAAFLETFRAGLSSGPKVGGQFDQQRLFSQLTGGDLGQVTREQRRAELNASIKAVVGLKDAEEDLRKALREGRITQDAYAIALKEVRENAERAREHIPQYAQAVKDLDDILLREKGFEQFNDTLISLSSESLE